MIIRKLIIKSINFGCLLNTVCFEVVSYWIIFSSYINGHIQLIYWIAFQSSTVQVWVPHILEQFRTSNQKRNVQSWKYANRVSYRGYFPTVGEQLQDSTWAAIQPLVWIKPIRAGIVGAAQSPAETLVKSQDLKLHRLEGHKP